MNIQTDRALIPAGSASERYLTVTITSPARPQRNQRPAVHVALVLDRSGSMAGRKIEMARKAVEHAVRLLNERDRLALVCYDTEIDTLLGATTATPEAKELALSRLRTIDARGSTDLCGGWLRGAQELGTPEPNTINRVLLLSDGLANHGETKPEALAHHAAELSKRGIATTTFGLGADYDETLMSRLATEGGGRFYFIEQPAQIPDIFASEIGEALEVVARDARLVIAADAGVEVGCLNEFPVETTSGEVHVRLGDLVSSQTLTVVIAVRCAARSEGDKAAVTLRLTDRDAALFPQPMVVEWRATADAVNAAQPVNNDVLIEVAQLIAARARAEALEANRRGNFVEAIAIVKAATANLRTLAPGVRQVEALAGELEAEQSDFSARMDAYEMKRKHFASRNVSYSRSTEGKAKRQPPAS